MGRLVTLSLTLRMLRPLFQIASSRFGSLSVHCGGHTETRYANAPYDPMTGMHILKDKLTWPIHLFLAVEMGHL